MENEILSEEKDWVYLAYILDNRVVDVLKCDRRMGAIVLSQPIIVEITEDQHLIGRDYLYDEKTNSFFKPIHMD